MSTGRIGQYTDTNTSHISDKISFNAVEHEMTRRELWMQAAVAGLGSGQNQTYAKIYATSILEAFDEKFGRQVKKG